MSQTSQIHSALAQAISLTTGKEPAEIKALFESPKNPAHGDISLPCFSLSRGTDEKPQDLAKRIKNTISLPDEFSSVSVIGPFLNFKLNYILLSKTIIEQACKSITCQTDASSKTHADKTVLVEYSSPNIAKPFHVGHLRATLLGNALDRIYRSAGYPTVSINHLGDWGTQFGFVWAGCKIWGEPEEFTVKNLVELYKKATALKDEQEKSAQDDKSEQVQDIARSYFLDLESGQEEAVDFWKRCVEVSLEYLKKTYERLGISFDHYLGESFYSDKLSGMEKELEDLGLLEKSEGAKGVQLGEPLGFARISTPDGRSLYLTRDLAAADYRYTRFGFSKSLYVVGSPQSLHFRQLKEILSKMGKPYADSITHVAFGHVLGMKTRGEGTTIELNDFLDEAYDRALAAYHSQVSKRPEGLDEKEVAEKVAKSAIIFSTLNRNNIKDVQFKWEDALSFQGDSGPYLLYAYARINGIAEKAQAAGISPATSSGLSPEVLSTPEAEDLLKSILQFDTIIENVLSTSEPVHLCSYALDLAKHISRAYLALKVVGEVKERAETSLALFTAARNQLGKAIILLGFEPLERM
jgi:arginyl-tRNA synthetase